MLRKILTEPDPILRKKCEPLEKVDIEIKKLMNEMLETMYDAPGIGLAAIQVGYDVRMFTMDCTRYQGKPQVFINPTIVKNSEETITDFEGCLSAPGKQGEVKRYIRITLNYKDEEGEEHQKTFYNMEARCIQHEMDHLEGKLCIDYEKGEYSRDKHNAQTMVDTDFRVKSDS